MNADKVQGTLPDKDKLTSNIITDSGLNIEMEFLTYTRHLNGI